MSYGFERALTKADSMTDLGAVAREGVKNALDMVFGVLPVVMAIGTCALMLAEHTPIFNWLGAPFVPLLELLHRRRRKRLPRPSWSVLPTCSFRRCWPRPSRVT